MYHTIEPIMPIEHLPWQTETLRFSFINLDADADLGRLGWAAITSSEPDTVSQKKATGIYTEEGEWLGGKLNVTKQPGRIDVSFTKEPNETPLPNAGPFFNVVDVFKAQSDRLAIFPAARYAFGGVLLLQVESRQAGYEYLKRFLPFVKFEEDMSDFFLQVNRRKSSELHVHVNEITKWSSVEVKYLVFNPDGTLNEPEPLHFARLEFDINTAEASPLSADFDFQGIIEEFFERAKNISQNGAL